MGIEPLAHSENVPHDACGAVIATGKRARAGGWLAVFCASSLIAEACGSKTDLSIGSDYQASGAGGVTLDAGPDAPLTEGGKGGAGGTADAAGAAGAAGAGGEVFCDPVELPPPLSLIHRYSFDGTGTAIVDSVGGADWNGTLKGNDGSALTGTGELDLAGKNGFVDLPNGIIHSLTNVTVMAWIWWGGGSAFQRIFDFGTTTRGEDPLWKALTGANELSYSGTSYFAASPYDAWDPGGNFGVELKTATTSRTHYGSFNSLKGTGVHQVSAVFENGVGARLYFDARLVGSFASPLAQLSEIVDENDWLGRSQTDSDNSYDGGYSEFRIYDSALTQCAIASQYAAGPDALAP